MKLMENVVMEMETKAKVLRFKVRDNETVMVFAIGGVMEAEFTRKTANQMLASTAARLGDPAKVYGGMLADFVEPRCDLTGMFKRTYSFSLDNLSS